MSNNPTDPTAKFKQCGTCVHFLPDVNSQTGRGACYRHPPLPLGMGITQRPEVFLQTQACGEHILCVVSVKRVTDNVPLPTPAETKAIVAGLKAQGQIYVDTSKGKMPRTGKRNLTV